MRKVKSSQRNKEQSKQRLIDAVGKIILRDGFKGIGINTIAKEADLDKVLIYRYFNGLDGLLHEYVKQKDFYMNIPDSIQEKIEKAEKHEAKELTGEILIGQFQGLAQNKELQEFMLWEMIEKNELTQTIAREREEKGNEINNKLKQKMNLQNNETDAVIALLVAGIYYLVLRSRTADIFNSIELNSEKGRKQIEHAIRLVVESFLTK